MKYLLFGIHDFFFLFPLFVQKANRPVEQKQK